MVKTTREAVLIVDVQPGFQPPEWLVERCQALADRFASVATVFRHNEGEVPFTAQLGWCPERIDGSLVQADHVFVKNGYAPSNGTVQHLKELNPERVYVCGIQADCCVLSAGFALFDAGLYPTLVADAVVGSSIDRSGKAGVDLWRHHFGAVVDTHRELL